MRAIWTGSISFGLVNIPVRLFSGSEHNEGLDLTMLHKKDKSPIRYARICKKDGKEIAFNEIVKGYEYSDGDYIILTDEDFERLLREFNTGQLVQRQPMQQQQSKESSE